MVRNSIVRIEAPAMRNLAALSLFSATRESIASTRCASTQQRQTGHSWGECSEAQQSRLIHRVCRWRLSVDLAHIWTDLTGRRAGTDRLPSVRYGASTGYVFRSGCSSVIAGWA